MTFPTANSELKAGSDINVTSNDADASVAFKPRFGFWSLLSYQIAFAGSWTAYLFSVGVSVDIGGPVGFLYGTLVVGFFQILTTLSLAEMASAWPHPGGALYWIIKLSPNGKSPLLSFFMGWTNAIAYIAALASNGFASTQVVTALITILHGYQWQRWQLCLIYWGFSLTFIPITLRPAWLPAWSFAGATFLAVMLVVTIGLWSSHIQPQSETFVFTEFMNNSGWSNSGLVFILSLVQTTYALTGIEAAVHMSAETKKPHRNIPLVLMSSVSFSIISCFCFAILCLFSLGRLDDLVNSSLGEIYLQLFVNSAGRAGGLAIATILLLLVDLFAGAETLVATSRIVWALARIGWVPHAPTFASTNPNTGAPVNATLLTVGISMLAGLLYIASDTAWNAIVSCTVGAYQITYFTPIIVLLIRGRSILPKRFFNLDRFPGLGYVINIVAVLWGIFIFIISLFPVYLPVTSSSMNYCIVVFGACGLFLVVFWVFYARKRSNIAGAEMQFIEMLH